MSKPARNSPRSSIQDGEPTFFVSSKTVEGKALRAVFRKYKSYIEENPVKAGLVQSAEDYPYCSLYLRKKKAAKAAGRD